MAGTWKKKAGKEQKKKLYNLLNKIDILYKMTFEQQFIWNNRHYVFNQIQYLPLILRCGYAVMMSEYNIFNMEQIYQYLDHLRLKKVQQKKLSEQEQTAERFGEEEEGFEEEETGSKEFFLKEKRQVLKKTG